MATLSPTLLDIQARAVPLGELLRSAREVAGSGAGEAASATGLDAWKRVIANGDEAAFAKRLRWDGLDEETAAGALRAPAAGSGLSWTETIRAAYGETHDDLRAALADAAPDRAQVAENALPFEALFVPLVRWARNALERRAGDDYARLDPAAHAALEQALLARLARICVKALYGELAGFRAVRHESVLFAGRGSAGVFAPFMEQMKSGGFVRFLAAYPVAARLCARVAELWVESGAEFIGRLAADAPALAATFGAAGRVTAVQTGLSDPHLGGRTVLIAHFACGARVVYKPRPVGMETFWGELLAWMNGNGGLHPLRTLAVLPRPTYGWIEWAEHRDCADAAAAERYYERCGMLLCLAQVLGASDFHCENLIASGEDPVLIDMEGLTNHRFALAEELATTSMPAPEATRRLALSVANTRMLPHLKVSEDGRAAADAGSLSRLDQDGEVEVAAWLDANGDAMRPGRRRVPHRQRLPNLPRVGGVQLPPAVERIGAGYRHSYRLLLARRAEWVREGGLVDGARGQRVRFIFRDTSLYGTLLERCLSPAYLRGGVERGIELEALARTLLRTDERPAVWPVLQAERDALEQMDIPYFDADAGSTALDLPGGAHAPDCFAASAVDEIRGRLNALSEADLRVQCAAIRTSYDALDTVGLRSRAAVHAPRPRPASGGLLQGAEAIGEAVLARATLSSRGEPSWLGVAYLARSRRHAIAAAPLGLGDGYGGIALFLAALAAHTGNERYRDAAVAALRPLSGRLDELERATRLRRLVDIGAGTGLGSAVYALARIGAMLGEPGLLAAAHRVADCITTRTIAEDRSFDLISGSAGAILGLLSLHEIGGREDLLRRAEECGRHLLASRTDEGGTPVWKTIHGTDAGFAHGQAGIAYALRRLAGLSGDGAFALAADAALRPGAVVEADERNAAWSHGATGIGLSRLAFRGAEADEELERALRLARAAMHEGTDDLACGTMGRVDLLLSAGVARGRPELVEEARQAAAAVLASAPDFRLVWRSGHFDAGLHLGLSGIGYQLLRLLDPVRFPSVLLWK